MRICLCFFVLFLFPLLHTGQSFLGKVNHYGIEDGLSHRDVRCIHQDKQGFIWFGTKYGLNRFDGKKFKWFTVEENGLQSNEIDHILEDKNGLMWLINTGGFSNKVPKSIDIFEPLSGQIWSFEDYFKDKTPFSISDIVSFNSSAGKIVFLTKDNKLMLYKEDFKSIPIQLEDYYRIQNIHWGPNDWIWIIRRNVSFDSSIKLLSLLAFDTSGQTVRHLSHSTLDFASIYHFEENGNIFYLASKITHSNEVFAFSSTPNGKILPDIELQNALQLHNLDNRTFSDLNLIKFQNGLFWISTDNSSPIINLFDRKGKVKIKWESLFYDISHTTSFLMDNFGSVWISTQFGVFQIQLNENHFSKLLNRTDGNNRPMRSMLVDSQNHLWAVEEAVPDFWKIDLNTGFSFQINKNLSPERRLLTGGSFVCLSSGKSNQFYYSRSKNLIEFDPISLQYKINTVFDPKVDKNFIWAIYQDDFDKVWLTTGNGGIGYWDGQKNNWLPPIDGLTYAYQFFKDKNGETWLVSDGGLFIIDMEKGTIKARFWSKGEGNNYFPFDNLYHVHEDENGAFWLGTGGSGLVHWEKPGFPDTWRQYTKAHGLSNNTIYAVYEDALQNLWLPSDYGLMCFNKNTKRCKAFLEEDGITHNEFNRISHFQSADGTLFFGGLNGITQFNPLDFQFDSTTIHPPLVLRDYQHYDEKGTLKTNQNVAEIIQKGITFFPNDRLLRLEFELLTFHEVDKINYAYKLEGEGPDWIYQKENTLRFSSLPYGKHTIRIKGQAANGQWSKKELNLNVLALKPYYLRTWFLISAGFLFVTNIYLVFKYRTAQLKRQKKVLEAEVARRTETISKQAKELKSLEQLKSRFFANVSHELRTPLTLLLGPVNTLLKDKKEDSKDHQLLHFVKRSGNQLLKLINEILDLSKLESGKIKIQEEPLHFYKFLNTIIAQFQSYADSEAVKFSIDYQGNKELSLLLDKDKVEKIIQNYLSNALKYSPPKSEVIFRIQEHKERILMSVHDKGPGIHPEDRPHIFDRFYQSKKDTSTPKGGTGIGLSLVKELAELLDGKVWVESEVGKGSVFYFQFPKKTVVGSRLSVDGFDHQKNKSALKTELSPKLEKENISQPISTKPQSTTDNQQLKTILLVEDNPDLRKYIKILLADYNVITAENGKAGLNCLLQNEDCQLIISDLMMPVMDGFEFLETVKSDDRWRHIPVIMLTAKVNAKAKLKALRIGVDDYLTKPFSEEELLTRIQNLLGNLQIRMELFATQEKVAEAPNSPVIAAVDTKWLKEVEDILNIKLPEYHLTMDKVAEELFISTRQLNRKIKKLTGLTASQYLQEMRLQQAKEYLLAGKYSTIKELSQAVGFTSSRYFSLLFQKHFGSLPSSYLPS